MKLVSTSVVCLLLAALNAAPLSAQSSWTVDDDGPADFASLQAAIDFASPGDRILIEPGIYGSVVVDKELALLGRQDAEHPRLAALDADGIAGLTLQHLRFFHVIENLALANIPGRVRIDDVVNYGQATFSACGDLLVTASQLTGAQRPLCGLPAVILNQATDAQFVDSTLVGGDGEILDFLTSGWGGPGLSIARDSRALVAGCSVRGGGGEPASLFGADEARGGDAILAAGDVDVRGSSADVIEGGPDNDGGGFDGFAIRNFGGTAVHGGVSVVGNTSFDVQELVPARPYLTLTGPAGPGAVQTANFHGRQDANGLLVTSIVPAKLSLPIVSTVPTYVNPNQVIEILPFTLLGIETPVQTSWALLDAPSLAGISYYVQGLQGNLVGGFVGTNVEQILLGY